METIRLQDLIAELPEETQKEVRQEAQQELDLIRFERQQELMHRLAEGD